HLLLTARLSGAQEVPAVTTNGQGVAGFTLNETRDTLFVQAAASGLSGPITDAQNLKSGNPAGGNPAGGEFWTDLVQGSTLIIELQEPIAGGGPSEVHLSAVVHAYKNLFPNTNKLFGQAGACHPNMVCYPDYQFEGDGVAMTLLSAASRLCTGSMVNDMRQSFRSFFLTAFHCVDIGATPGTLTTSEITNAQNWLVRFNYQSTTCTPGVDDLDVITLNGTTFRAGSSNSDFTLVELTQQVPPDVNTTYNGWNRGAATTSNNFGIHHHRAT
ncbi:MAG: CHRD domain-containing protein, partial [Rudanella sp.]|nr:CHRD domain-containing protein [Rudanella sp.]